MMGSRKDVLARLSACIARVLNLPSLQLTGDMDAADVPGWDSLNHILIVFELEKEFAIELSPEEVADVANFDALVDLIKSQCAPNT